MNSHSVKKHFEQARAEAEAHPDNARAHYNLGLAHTRAGRMDSAAAAYRRALELDPTLAQAWVNLGGALLLKWDFKGAAEANEKALELNPGLVEAHFGLGQARLYLEQADEVVRCNRKVVELDPEHAAGHYYLAVGLLDQGDAAAAREELSQAMSLGHRPRPEFLKGLEKAELRQQRKGVEQAENQK